MTASEIHELVLPGGVPITCRCAIGNDHNLSDLENLVPAPTLVGPSIEELTEHLNHLNDTGIGDTAVIITRHGALLFAYCTDPDGEWFLVNGNPTEQLRYEVDALGRPRPDLDTWYQPLDLDEFAGHGPFRVIDGGWAGQINRRTW